MQGFGRVTFTDCVTSFVASLLEGSFLMFAD